MYRDFGENIIFKNYVIVEVEKLDAARTVLTFQFHNIAQGEALVATLREAADRMERELREWREAQEDGKWL